MSMTARATNINPRGYQFGFIYNELSNTKTIAHELCHGAYHLRHTFDEADYLAPEGTTDNLMDYAAANDRTFNHWQWQDIHQPKNVRFKWAQDEEGAEWTTDGHYYLFTCLGIIMGMPYSEAEELGRYAEEPDSHYIQDSERGSTINMGNNKTIRIQKYYKKGDVLIGHKAHYPQDFTKCSYFSYDDYYNVELEEKVHFYSWDNVVLNDNNIKYKKVIVEGENGKSKKNITIKINKSRKDVLENTTWLYGGTQQLYHALTGGYHGVELAVTAYAIKRFRDWQWGNKIQGFLLHRFGDCFAHFRISEDIKGFKDKQLSKYTDAFDNELTKYYVLCNIGQVVNISMQGCSDISHCMKKGDIILYNNKLYTTYEIDELRKMLCIMVLESDASRVYMYERECHMIGNDANKVVCTIVDKKVAKIKKLHDFILDQLLKTSDPQDRYEMYGDNMEAIIKTTVGHTYDSKCGNSPDEIFRRPNLFKCYSNRVIELLENESINGVGTGFFASEKAKDIVKLITDFGEEKLIYYHGQVKYAYPMYFGIPGYTYTYVEYEFDYKNARLDAVWAYLIAINSGEKSFVIPVKSLPQELRTDIRTKIVYDRDFDNNQAAKDARDQIRILDDFIDYINKTNKDAKYDKYRNHKIVQKDITTNGIECIIINK